MTPEGKVKAEIKRILVTHKIYHFMPQPGLACRRGIPDFICSVNGFMLAIEAKAADKKPTALQQRELDAINASGGIALCINATNLDTLVSSIAYLKSLEVR